MVEALATLANEATNFVTTTATMVNVSPDAWSSIGQGINTAFERIRATVITPLGAIAILVIAIKLLLAPDPQSVKTNKTALIVVIAAVALCWLAPAFVNWAKSLGGG